MRFEGKESAANFFQGIEDGGWTTDGFFQTYGGGAGAAVLSSEAQGLSDIYRKAYAQRKRRQEAEGARIAVDRSDRIRRRRHGR